MPGVGPSGGKATRQCAGCPASGVDPSHVIGGWNRRGLIGRALRLSRLDGVESTTEAAP
jgi:hypothetical protein